MCGALGPAILPGRWPCPGPGQPRRWPGRQSSAPWGRRVRVRPGRRSLLALLDLVCQVAGLLGAERGAQLRPDLAPASSSSPLLMPPLRRPMQGTPARPSQTVSPANIPVRARSGHSAARPEPGRALACPGPYPQQTSPPSMASSRRELHGGRRTLAGRQTWPGLLAGPRQPWPDGTAASSSCTTPPSGLRCADGAGGAFGLPPGDVGVVCPHVGCGFGCMGYGWPRSDGRIAWAMLLAAALAATVTCRAGVPCWPRWIRAFASLRRSAWARGFCDVQRARDKELHPAMQAPGNCWARGALAPPR
jgi:hypothetical protein